MKKKRKHFSPIDSASRDKDRESSKVLCTIRKRLYDDLQPVGFLEERICDTIALAYLREGRLDRIAVEKSIIGDVASLCENEKARKLVLENIANNIKRLGSVQKQRFLRENNSKEQNRIKYREKNEEEALANAINLLEGNSK